MKKNESENIDFIQVELGKWECRKGSYMVEIQIKDILCVVQYSVLSTGIFVPCCDLSEFKCDMKCSSKKAFRCPYATSSEEIIASEIAYFNCDGTIKSVLDEVKEWVLKICENQDTAEIFSRTWNFIGEN